MSHRAVESPIQLHTVVRYWGESALIVGRSKSVHGAWQYDLLISRDGRLVVVPSLLAEEFGDRTDAVLAERNAATDAGALRYHETHDLRPSEVRVMTPAGEP